MFELRVLGTLQLKAPNRRDVESLSHQAKRAALLAYLAAATPRGTHRRDKLLPLFWPELDQTHARAALNQAVYVLRAMLGENALIPHGDGALGLADVVWCDAAAFEAALDAGRPAEAMKLYRGDLLEGFFISDAPEFERWLETERERLRQRAAQGAWALAEEKAAKGDIVEAEDWARRAAELAPADEAVIRRLMMFLNELGDRAAAVRVYEEFVARLASEYELEPSAETQALATTVRANVPAIEASGPVAHDASPTVSVDVAAVPAVGNDGPRKWRRGRIMVAAALLPMIAAGTWGLFLSRRHNSPASVVRFTLEFPANQRMVTNSGGPTIALSPDGSLLVYQAEGLQGAQLYLRPIDRVNAVPIPHTRGARYPFFSPDGEWLGFVIGDAMHKVPISGGPAITITEVAMGLSGGSWGTNGVIVFTTPGGLWQVSAAGGEPRMIVASDNEGFERFRWPDVLPSGRAAVFTTVDESGFELAAVNVETGAVVPLGIEGVSPRFIPPRHLLFARNDGALLAVPFDPDKLRVTGAVFPVAENVLVGIAGAAKLGVSRQGTFAYMPERSSDRTLVVVNRVGLVDSVPVRPAGFTSARFSPDGRQIAAAVRPAHGEQQDIWVIDLSTNTFRRLTYDHGNVSPLWTPDGRRVVYASKPGGRYSGWSIRWIAADGSDTAEIIVPAEVGQFPRAFTSNGRVLVFERLHPSTGQDIWTLSLEGQRVVEPYLTGPFNEHSPAISPDGRWLAYVCDESGQSEVYVRPFRTAGGQSQVSLGGGRQPQWAPTGQEIFYHSEQGLVAAAIALSPSFRVLRREVLFEDPYRVHRPEANYDVHPDSRRFLMVRPGSEVPQVVVVLNLFGRHRQSTS